MTFTSYMEYWQKKANKEGFDLYADDENKTIVNVYNTIPSDKGATSQRKESTFQEGFNEDGTPCYTEDNKFVYKNASKTNRILYERIDTLESRIDTAVAYIDDPKNSIEDKHKRILKKILTI